MIQHVLRYYKLRQLSKIEARAWIINAIDSAQRIVTYFQCDPMARLFFRFGHLQQWKLTQ